MSLLKSNSTKFLDLELCLKLEISYKGNLSLIPNEATQHLGVYEFMGHRENDVEGAIYMMNTDQTISWIYNNEQKWQGTVIDISYFKSTCLF